MFEFAIHDQTAIEDPSFAKRFWAKASLSESGCLLWLGSVKGCGYPSIKVKRRWLKAHRVAFAMAFGNFERSKVVMHSCDNPRCINPDHLHLGTLAENSRDMVRKDRGSRSGGGSARLSEQQVRKLAAMRDAGASLRELGRTFSVSPSSVRWRLGHQPVRFGNAAHNVPAGDA